MIDVKTIIPVHKEKRATIKQCCEQLHEQVMNGKTSICFKYII